MKRLLRHLKQPWNDKVNGYVAVTTLLLAGTATLVTFASAAYGNDALLAQTQLSNCWSYYQAKSIKEHAFQLHRDLLLLIPASDNTTITHYNSEIERYRQEKYALMQEANKLSHTREKAEHYAASFGNSLIFLQVGILLSSLASVNRISYYWYGSILAGISSLIALVFTLFTK